jgi:hypothetical protein
MASRNSSRHRNNIQLASRLLSAILSYVALDNLLSSGSQFDPVDGGKDLLQVLPSLPAVGQAECKFRKRLYYYYYHIIVVLEGTL